MNCSKFAQKYCMELDNKYCYSIELDVRDYEIDSEGIVNNANYLHYLEHALHRFCDHAGFSFKAMQDAGLIQCSTAWKWSTKRQCAVATAW